MLATCSTAKLVFNMGCNQSKQQDIATSKNRTRINEDEAAFVRSPTQPIASPKRSSDFEAGIARSLKQEQIEDQYMDDLLEGTSMYQHIIDKTAQNFIDVFQSTPDADEAFQRNYAEYINEVDLKGDLLLSLPHSTHNLEKEELVATLSSISLNNDKDMLKTVCSEIDSSLASLAVRDRGVIVVPFPEL